MERATVHAGDPAVNDDAPVVSRAEGVRTEEPHEGLVARMLRRSLQKKLDTALSDGVGHLRAEAERVISTPP